MQLVLVVGLLLPGSASAWSDPGTMDWLWDPRVPRGLHVLDGSYVMTTNRLHVNITDFGLIGSRYSEVSTFSHAPSAQWPAGTGDEDLFAAGL